MVQFSFIATAFISVLLRASGFEYERRQMTPCISQCGNIYTAATSCTEGDCLCPTVLLSGEACLSCWATINASVVAEVSSAVAYCTSASNCSSQCSGLFSAALSCGTNYTCLCPALATNAPSCLSCFAAGTPNQTDAIFISSVLATDCQGLLTTPPVMSTITSGPSLTGAVPSTGAPSPSGGVSSSTSRPSAQASSGAWKCGAHVSETGFLQMTIFIAFVAGLFFGFI